MQFLKDYIDVASPEIKTTLQVKFSKILNQHEQHKLARRPDSHPENALYMYVPSVGLYNPDFTMTLTFDLVASKFLIISHLNNEYGVCQLNNQIHYITQSHNPVVTNKSIDIFL